MKEAGPCPAPWRKSGAFLWVVSLALLLWALTFLHASLALREGEDEVHRRRELVGQLDLTDLALFTEARYTRHPSQADLHSPFQDHPLALEHFPTGSLVPAPVRSSWPAPTEPPPTSLPEARGLGLSEPPTADVPEARGMDLPIPPTAGVPGLSAASLPAPSTSVPVFGPPGPGARP